ncbi:MAG: DUF4406 domain-containing protein [Candidatus Aenigmarchaeota archaeon]|nr:DUF4406 domain-containing protein [Candidatus Aenigmarchaeota archaeon]
MKRIFISGPFSANTKEEMARNAGVANWYAIRIFKLGADVFLPHTMFFYWEDKVDYNKILDSCIRWLWCCDAIFMLPKWSSSYGSVREKQMARLLKLPVLTSLKQVKKFIKEGRSGKNH